MNKVFIERQFSIEKSCIAVDISISISIMQPLHPLLWHGDVIGCLKVAPANSAQPVQLYCLTCIGNFADLVH